MPLSVRRGTTDDLQGIVALTRELARETENGLELDVQRVTAGVAAGLTEVSTTPLVPRYWVATLDDAVVGCLAISPEWSDWWNCCYWWITSIIVDAAHRRQGVGRAMVQAMLDAAERESVQTVNLRVEAKNDSARQFYVDMGFAADNSHIVMARGRKPDNSAVGDTGGDGSSQTEAEAEAEAADFT